MRSVCLHDKASIERVLRPNVYLHLYSIGDLDDFFWPYTTWYATEDETEPRSLALLYTGQSLPALLALSENSEAIHGLLESISDLLPQQFYAHLSPGVDAALRPTHKLEAHGEHIKMALVRRSAVESVPCEGTCSLGQENAGEMAEFYARCYPGNWFDPRMLDTRQYFGIRAGGHLVSVAGIHVYSRKYQVAALGNVATLPSHRNKGYAKRVTARTCQSLLGDVRHIGLNVKADNNAAIACYRRLGFEPVASYFEYMVSSQ